MIPTIILTDTELVAELGVHLMRVRATSFSPHQSNHFVVTSFEIESLAEKCQDTRLKAELEKYAYALRLVGEVTFAHDAAVVRSFANTVEKLIEVNEKARDAGSN